MLPAYLYQPGMFYGVVMSIAFALSIVVAYLNTLKGKQPAQLALLLVNLAVPAVVALAMIFNSGNALLIQDFWQRLFLFKISPMYLIIILFLVPLVMLIATGISLFFGYSSEQFSLTNEFTAMKGWGFLGLIIPLVLAPFIEELGWRSYGIDSIRAHVNLFATSLIFGFLWAIWHLPAFFVKGFYQNQLWHLGKRYALNFFVSAFFISFIMNWVFYRTDRSIPALILFHAVVNLSAMLLKTEQFTKCIVTILMSLVSLSLIVFDRSFFFSFF